MLRRIVKPTIAPSHQRTAGGEPDRGEVDPVIGERPHNEPATHAAHKQEVGQPAKPLARRSAQREPAGRP